ncbi:MAG: hypothetical protein JWP97_4491 [Labilithrix sp.]|nr:hypothetical protein [Labilithrix sp.]
MTRIVHVVVAGEVGGAERMLVDLAGPAARDQHSVALFTPSPRLRALFTSSGLVVDDRGAVREDAVSYLLRSLGPGDVRWLEDVLVRRRAEIVHVHTFASQVLGTRAAARLGLPLVRTEHSTRVYDDPSCWPFSRWSLRRAAAAVCISEHVARAARARAPWATGALTVVPNGVDTDHFAAAPPRARGPGDALRFVALGRLDRRKGLDRALAALVRVPGAELHVVGDGDERAALERLARELGVVSRVHFLGYASDVRASVAASDAALSSARAEGLGIALLEAMAMQRPVIALPTGGVPEIVTDGETGWLARPPAPGATEEDLVAVLAQRMQEAVDLPAEVARRGSLAREGVVARFSLDAMRRGYEAVYSRLAPRLV